MFKQVLVVCISAVLALPAGDLRGEEEPQSATPNVVILLADDIAWNDYGFMGHKQIETPSLDRLARESVVFTQGHVPTSLCRASLMSLATGLYAHQHGVTGNDPPKGTTREAMLTFVDRAPTLPRLLAEGVYSTLQTGKWWEGTFERGGFTHGMTHGEPSRGGRHGDVGLTIGRQGIQPIRDFLDAHGDKPFFLWYAPLLPHQPHDPPERLLAKYRGRMESLHIAKYWAMVEWFDETCGAVLKELRSRDLERNTIVVYLGDNGWIQQPNAATFDERSKRSRFEPGLRTPIMLRWPEKFKPRRDDTLVSSIDLAPTILAACGLKPTAAMRGENLLPLAVDGKPLERDIVFGEIFDHDVVELDRPAASLQCRWCIEGTWKLIVPTHDQPVELFDLASDPQEANNVAKQQPEIVARLTKKLDAWWMP